MTVLPSSMSPLIIQALMLLYTRLEEADFAWAITGSAGMALQGMPLDAHDIDLQTDQPGAYEIQALLAEFIKEPVAFRESPLPGREGARIRSHLGALEVSGVRVEIMGDVSYWNGTEWSDPPNLPGIIRHAQYGEMRLPVIDLEHEYRAYQEMGRTERAEEIRRWLEERKE